MEDLVRSTRTFTTYPFPEANLAYLFRLSPLPSNIWQGKNGIQAISSHQYMLIVVIAHPPIFLGGNDDRKVWKNDILDEVDGIGDRCER